MYITGIFVNVYTTKPKKAAMFVQDWACIFLHRDVIYIHKQRTHHRVTGGFIMEKKDIKKIVLAYSGGLDTSIIIPWLKENYNNPEIIAVSGNVGQADELEGLEEKAIKTGASKCIVADLTEEYVNDFIIPCMKAGAVYEEYLLGTS